MQTVVLADLDSLYPNPYQRQVRTGGIDRAHAARLEAVIAAIAGDGAISVEIAEPAAAAP